MYKRPYSPQPENEPSLPASDNPPTGSLSPVSSLRDGTVVAVAKFIMNAQAGKESSLISRTFGKVAIVDRAWTSAMSGHVETPKNDEFWLVDIVRDQFPGTNRGVLILHPRYPLAATEPTRLFPGTFDEEIVDGILYVRPKHAGPYWIASLNLKDMLLKRHLKPNALIVSIATPPDAMTRAVKAVKA